METLKGRDVLTPKNSAVRANGEMQQARIKGLQVRFIRPVPHEDGVLSEVARLDWPEMGAPIVQVHLTTTLPGRVRAWGLHQRTTDRLFVVRGLISVVVFDGRRDSATFGAINEFKLGERNPALVVIPPFLYHGWKNLGVDEADILNLPTEMYRYDSPDALDLPYDDPSAAEIVPFRW